MNDDYSKLKFIIKNIENYLLIKLCHDLILLITADKISFKGKKKNSYDGMMSFLKILKPFIEISPDDVFLQCEPAKVTFTYPISNKL